MVNFYNPLRPRKNPGAQAIEGALEGRLAPSKLRRTCEVSGLKREFERLLEDLAAGS